VQLPEGGILTETLAILVTIDERFPSAKLLPERGTFARAQALRWLAFMASEIYPMGRSAIIPRALLREGEESKALRRKAGERVRARLAIVEEAVAGPFLLAEVFPPQISMAAMFSRWSEARQANLPKLAVLSRAVAERPRIASIWSSHSSTNVIACPAFGSRDDFTQDNGRRRVCRHLAPPLFIAVMTAAFYGGQVRRTTRGASGR